jgi:hypothetical protein
LRAICVALIGIVLLFPASAVSSGPDDCALRGVLPQPGFAAGWTLKEPTNLYVRDTLFEHIDGEAELFMPYGFDLLATATYVSASDPDVWLVADVYRMGSPLDAFGIYSNYRRGREELIDFGAEGFILPSQLMFYQDRYFVRLQVTGANSLPRSEFLACGRAIGQRLPNQKGRPRELEIVRVPDLVPGSERYFAKSLLGYAFFRRGLLAEALADGKRIRIFVVLEANGEAAGETLARYESHLAAEGRSFRRQDGGTPDSLAATDPLYGDAHIRRIGRFLVGVLGANQADAERVIEQIGARIAALPTLRGRPGPAGGTP